MTTLRMPRWEELSQEDRDTLARVARRMGQTPEDLLRPGVFGVQAHWPAWLEANFEHTLATYRFHGVIPPLAKEAMHVSVSMTNPVSFNTIAHGMRLEPPVADITATDVAPGDRRERLEHIVPGARRHSGGPTSEE